MSKPLRLALALALLAGSLILLAWAFWPGERVIQRRWIAPTEMQLPNRGGSLSTPGEKAARPVWYRADVRPLPSAQGFVLIL